MGLTAVVVPLIFLALAAVPDAASRRQALEHYRAGEAALAGEDWKIAERRFKAAIALDPLLGIAHYGLGQTYMQSRQYPKAVDAFVACREAWRQVAALAFTDVRQADQRREDEIRELRDHLAALRAGRVKSASPLNQVLRLESRIQELERQRRRGGGPPEMPAEISLALGSAQFRSGNLAEAERAYREALETNPGMGEAHNNLAVVLMLTSRLPQAEKAISLAEKAGYPVNPQFKKDLAARKTGE